MAEFATVARPYAKALFELAEEKGQTDSIAEMLKVLCEIAQQPKVRLLLDNPEIGAGAKASALLSLPEQKPCTELANFVQVLAENKRLEALSEIHTMFRRYALSRTHTGEAVVYTAYAMDDAQFAQVLSELEAHFKTGLEARQVVDPALIGGIKVEVGDRVLDMSVQGRLNGLHAAMMN